MTNNKNMNFINPNAYNIFTDFNSVNIGDSILDHDGEIMATVINKDANGNIKIRNLDTGRVIDGMTEDNAKHLGFRFARQKPSKNVSLSEDEELEISECLRIAGILTEEETNNSSSNITNPLTKDVDYDEELEYIDSYRRPIEGVSLLPTVPLEKGDVIYVNDYPTFYVDDPKFMGNSIRFIELNGLSGYTFTIEEINEARKANRIKVWRRKTW